MSLWIFLRKYLLYISLNQCKYEIHERRIIIRNIFYKALALLFLHIFVFIFFLAKHPLRPQRMSG